MNIYIHLTIDDELIYVIIYLKKVNELLVVAIVVDFIRKNVLYIIHFTSIQAKLESRNET